MYINWETVWSNTISGIITGLVVGGILGLVGFIIWKKQLLYSKKFEVYSTYVKILNDYIINIGTLYMIKNQTHKNTFIEKINKNEEALKELELSIILYLGYKKVEKLSVVFEISRKIKENNDIGMNEDELLKFLLEVNNEIEYMKIK